MNEKMAMAKIRIAVLASGNGSDFQSIIDGVEAKKVNAEIVALITDNPNANALNRAKKHGIASQVIDFKSYSDRMKFDLDVKKKLDELKLDLVVLAGYMKLIKSKEWLKDYAGKMINIHPSLLPKFPGAHGQQDAFETGEKVSGYTIHFVDDSLDGGPIILQEKVDISNCKSVDEVKAKILAQEHVGLPKVVDMFSKGGFVIEEGKKGEMKRAKFVPDKQ
ncbi:Phosphoribosylglycinamide formyltransferase [Candidatus Gugararchaeum adminiculabundum]|nr:Phosphoribosylglycinamide formyltransferase [Candidatus Gugararchaeum adminiculabundum]